ncbi:HD domain-containing phosphohydrolase [Solidesulfovibrio sp.]|uniref:HD domain-containing phosphohydrolase n=1 Tax=Solidesulfovibrio sp. TaxID=2910990 RepID=UPI002B20DB6E|nr:HD domain-containing phosphohydrolase [Solidesulfovibrio sp.]MEA4857621.1 PAS domain S-box protein [Solidesulfovibrio sp.]
MAGPAPTSLAGRAAAPMDAAAVLFHDAPLAIYLRAPDGSFLEVNRAMAQLFGYDSPGQFLEAMAAFPDQHYLDPASRRAVLDELAATGFVTGRQYQAMGRDGFVLWVEESARLVDAGGDEHYYFGYLRDITAEKSTKWALTEAEEKYRASFEHAVEGLFQMTPAGRFVTVNDALCAMLGFPAATALTDDPEAAARLFVDDGTRRGLTLALEEADMVRALDAELRRADGTRIWVSIHARAVRDGNGRVVLHEGSMVDVTERRLSQEQLRQSLARTSLLFHQTVTSLSKTVRYRDPYTAGHQDSVSRLATAMARRLGLSADEAAGIRVAGQLHDIGKIVVPVRYLCKPGRLVGLEWEFMRQHAQAGYEILKEIDFPWPVAAVVWAHHERLDGSGYPRGLSGPDIPLGARILAVADVLDAMASNRPYRPALGVAAALEELARHRGTGFDAAAVDAARSVIRDGLIRY